MSTMRGARTQYRILIGIAVLAALTWTLRRLDLLEVVREIQGADWVLLSAAGLLTVAPLALRTLRAAFIFHRAGYTGVPFREMGAITIFGFSLSSVTPAGAGDLLRVAALRPYGVVARDSVSIVVFERTLDVLVMLALLGIALLVTLAPSLIASVAILAFACISGLLMLLWWRRPPSPGSLERFLPAFASRLLPGARTTEALLAPSTLFASLLLTALVFGFEALRPWLVIRALGLDVGIFAAWAIFTLALLSGLATLLPLGLGSWETAGVWAFSLYGFDMNTGAAGVVLLRAGVTLPTLLAGFVSLILLRRIRRGQASTSTD